MTCSWPVSAANPRLDSAMNETNQQVYALYGLTPEEIKIVEESSRR
jgi:hypothetical protein